MRILFILLFFCFTSTVTKSQSETEWFPAGFNIQPFTANFFESRAGMVYLFGEQNLRLDIGYSTDIIRIKLENSSFSAGADLFTFTRLREAENFHFPVEAVDYFFGLNAGYKISDGKNEYGFRFRFSHISAHLVDGRYIRGSDTWVDGQFPRVYSREFIEVFPFYTFNTFRVYTGLTYIFHVKPSWVGKGIYQLGFDYFLTEIINPNIIPFIAYDFRLSEVRKFTGNNIIYIGVRFGKYNSKGVSVRFGYYSGKSVHGEFFENNEDYFISGINIEL